MMRNKSVLDINGKISPAFGPFLADSGENGKRDAIVVYQAPQQEELRVRGRLRELKQRLDRIKLLAAQQREVEKKIAENYQKASRELGYTNETLEVDLIGSGTLPVATVEVTRNTLQALAEQAEVVAILPDQPIQLVQPQKINYSHLSSDEQQDGLTWGLRSLNIPEIWETTQGEDINVAVLDTGVYAEHPVLNDRVKEFIVIDPLGRKIKATPAFDAGQHGTHVCGTIAGGITQDGVAIGVAPKANLLVAGILFGGATVRTVLEGISWAIDNNADIINMSLGFPYYEPKFADFLDRVVTQFGVLPVVSIGNSNHGNSCSPGNVPSAFSVGAVERFPKTELGVAHFSSGVSLVFPGQNPSLITKPDVVAPGCQVYSCIPTINLPDGNIYKYTYMDGTSMAAPHVAGVAALLMAANLTAPATAIMEALKETAQHPHGSQLRPDNRWGHGLIQPVEALKALK